jgi:hypothetical protein
MAELAAIQSNHAPLARTNDGGDVLITLIERLVRDPNSDPAKLERFLDVIAKEDERKAKQAFNEAISAAKGEIPTINKNRTVDFTSAKGRTYYKYEDLGEIARIVDPVLKKHGLSYRFRSHQNGQKLTITCIVSHARGHFEENTLEASEDHSGNKNAIQAIGSAAAYLQRYTLKLALGLAASSDTDGNAKPQTPASDTTPISAAQVIELQKLIVETSTDEAKFLAFGGIDSLADITVASFASARGKLMAKKARMSETK